MQKFDNLSGLTFTKKFNISIGCDVTLNGPSGAFTSPGYPSNYPNNKKCQITITVDNGKLIILKFSAFDLEEFATCPFDFVEIIDGSRKEKYCGNTIPPAYKSKGNSILVKFESDSSVSKKGFNASFTTIGKHFHYVLMISFSGEIAML